MNDYGRRGNCGRPCSGMPANNRQNQMQPQYQAYPASSPCCDRGDELEGMPLAMAYVPWQNWKDIYDLKQAFQTGTIFCELDKPFRWKGGGCR